MKEKVGQHIHKWFRPAWSKISHFNFLPLPKKGDAIKKDAEVQRVAKPVICSQITAVCCCDIFLLKIMKYSILTSKYWKMCRGPKSLGLENTIKFKSSSQICLLQYSNIRGKRKHWELTKTAQLILTKEPEIIKVINLSLLLSYCDWNEYQPNSIIRLWE